MDCVEKLTEEQAKLVADNYDMIDKFMSRRCLTYNSTEDWHGIFAYCLCVASKKYDSSIGTSFRAFAYWHLRSGYSHEISRIVNKRKLFREYSLDRKNNIYNTNGDSDTASSYMETLAAESSGLPIEERMDMQNAYNKTIKHFRPDHVEKIAEYYNSGKTLEEVGKKYNITRQQMSRITLKFIRILKRNFGTDTR